MTDRGCFCSATGKLILENLTGEVDATIIKKFEINLFFNTSFFV